MVILNGRPYIIRHNAKEQRFGLKDGVRFWVKRAIDLKAGSLKIMNPYFTKGSCLVSGILNLSAFEAPKGYPHPRPGLQ